MLQTFPYEAIDARTRGVFMNLEEQTVSFKVSQSPEMTTVQQKAVLRSKSRD